MFSKTIPAALLAIVFGIVLGCIPGLNENLHWNLWYVIPISGLIFGLLAGAIQFGYCFKVNQNLTKMVIVILVIAAVIGYICVEFGIYQTLEIPIEGHEEIPDGVYNIRQLVSFWDFMKWVYGQSVWDTVSYVVDLLGVTLGVTAMMLICKEKYPYCIPCNMYKQREQKYQIMLQFDEQKMQEMFKRLTELIDAGVYAPLVQYFQKLAKEYNDKKSNFKIDVDQRYCSSCLEATILGKVYRKKGGEWQEENDLKFLFTSQPGEHASFDAIDNVCA